MNEAERVALADFFNDKRDITSFDKLVEWLTRVSGKRWTWVRNSRCKYVIIKIDTRSGAYRIEDRDGNPITFAELSHQYGENPLGQSVATILKEQDDAVIS